MKFPFKNSGKSVRLSELDQAIKKLKGLYRKYAGIYGENIFNIAAFEKRYIDALKNKVDINIFLHAEISVFEELKRRVINANKVKEKKHEGNVSYSEIADRIIKENLLKIKKYRFVDIHPDAEIEVKYLIGAVTDYYYNIWSAATTIIRKLRNPVFDRQMEKLEHDFSYYVVPTKGSYSRAVDDYLFVLSKKNPVNNEKASINFLKYGGILLNNCLKLMGEAYNIMSGLKDELNLKRLNQLIDATRKIINDFRLGDIREF